MRKSLCCSTGRIISGKLQNSFCSKAQTGLIREAALSGWTCLLTGTCVANCPQGSSQTQLLALSQCLMLLGLMRLRKNISGHDASSVSTVETAQGMPTVEHGILPIAFTSSLKDKTWHSAEGEREHWKLFLAFFG